MKIKNICIDGVGGIKHLELNFNEGMNLICGINGIGKTTILECISHFFIRSRTSKLTRNVNYKTGNVRGVFFKNKVDNVLKYEIKDFEPEKVNYVFLDEEQYSRDVIVFNQLRSFEYIKLDSISRDKERTAIKNEELAYKGVNAEDIKDWFVQRFLWSKHENVLNLQQEYNLEKAKEMFSILDSEVSFSRIKADTFDILIHTKQGEIYFEYLSSGYKSCVYILLGIIKEIEYRYKEPYIKLEQFNGIILIDEIDVHLHPQWQARLMQSLKILLPNAQIIATTHSPSIIQAAEKDEIIPLYFDENNDICINKLEENEYGYKGWTIEEILRDVMGMEETKSNFYEETLRNFDKAIDEDDINTAKNCYQILNKMLHPKNYLRKILEIQMVGLGGENDKNN